MNEVFWFKKLKKDLAEFTKSIAITKPDIILGISGISGESRMETRAINKFNKGTISRNSREFYVLYCPKVGLNKAKRPSHSFCNWTMFKIAELIEKMKIDTKLVFLHVGTDNKKIKIQDII